MKRRWLLLPLLLTACALAFSALALNRTWATTPAPPSPASTGEESDAVPPVVRETFEADLKKAQEKSQAEAPTPLGASSEPYPTEAKRPATPESAAPPVAASPSSDPPAGTPVPAVASALPKQGLVPELVAILNETKSIDTFLVTLRLLESMGKQAEPAIPAIIRNAERLELFKDHSSRKEGNSERMDGIMKSLEKIRGQEAAGPYGGHKAS